MQVVAVVLVKVALLVQVVQVAVALVLTHLEQMEAQILVVEVEVVLLFQTVLAVQDWLLFLILATNYF
jgi:hypothetical protein